jgi:O-antigen/teichoic acid export membrane protein
MKPLSRSTALKIAVVLSLILGVIGLVFALPMLSRGVSDIERANDAPPYFIVLSGFVFAILRLVGAYGTWREQRWGIVITILANALDSILALPGIFYAPTTELWLSAIFGVAVSVVIIVLCLWRDPKPMTA